MTTTHASTQVDLATAQLEELIDSQRRGGNLRLPREIDLSEQLGVSRNTLREALTRLAARGVIERRRRHGTFIVAPDAASTASRSEGRLHYPIDEIVSLPAFFGAAGEAFSIQSVAVSTEPATSMDATKLGLPASTPVYRVRRVYAYDGSNIAVGEHVLATTLRGHGVQIDALTDGISNFLNEVEHISVDVVHHSATAIAADAMAARDLQVPVGAPLLAIDADLRNGDEEARTVAIGRLLFHPNRVSATATGYRR